MFCLKNMFNDNMCFLIVFGFFLLKKHIGIQYIKPKYKITFMALYQKT